MGTAIYLVVVEARQPSAPQWLQVWDVILCVPCFLETYDAIWREHVAPLQETGRRIQTWFVGREPYPNPFQEKAAEGIKK